MKERDLVPWQFLNLYQMTLFSPFVPLHYQGTIPCLLFLQIFLIHQPTAVLEITLRLTTTKNFPHKMPAFRYWQGHCNEHGRRLPLLLCPGDSFQTQGQRRIRLRNIPPHGVSEAQKAGIIRCITHYLNIRIHRRKPYSAPTYIESHQTHEMECFVA
jgi:hypothetical protein